VALLVYIHGLQEKLRTADIRSINPLTTFSVGCRTSALKMWRSEVAELKPVLSPITSLWCPLLSRTALRSVARAQRGRLHRGS
jgi:hypothetical protein